MSREHGIPAVAAEGHARHTVAAVDEGEDGSSDVGREAV